MDIALILVERKTLRESQNAALRTSHRLSNRSNCSFQNYWERFSYRIDNSDSSEKVHTTSPQKIMQHLLFFTLSVLFVSAIWHIWQPMWCCQGSVLQFSRCFFFLIWLQIEFYCHFCHYSHYSHYSHYGHYCYYCYYCHYCHYCCIGN